MSAIFRNIVTKATVTLATAKANGEHWSDTTNYNEVVQTDDLDRVRRYHADVPKGQQSNQKLGSKNRP